MRARVKGASNTISPDRADQFLHMQQKQKELETEAVPPPRRGGVCGVGLWWWGEGGEEGGKSSVDLLSSPPWLKTQSQLSSLPLLLAKKTKKKTDDNDVVDVDPDGCSFRICISLDPAACARAPPQL